MLVLLAVTLKVFWHWRVCGCCENDNQQIVGLEHKNKGKKYFKRFFCFHINMFSSG